MLDTASSLAAIEALTQPLQPCDHLQPFWPLADYQALGFGRSRYSEPDFVMRSLLQMRQCEQFRQDHGYVLATREAMQVLVEFFKPLGTVMDAGCGSGFLAQYLQACGVRTLAVDHCDYRVPRNERGGYPITQSLVLDVVAHAPALITPALGAVLLAWPPFMTNFALEVAQAMTPGQFLVFQGEIHGCTANDAFFEEVAHARRWRVQDEVSAQLNAVHVRFPAFHDRWLVLERLG